MVLCGSGFPATQGFMVKLLERDLPDGSHFSFMTFYEVSHLFSTIERLLMWIVLEGNRVHLLMANGRVLESMCMTFWKCCCSPSWEILSELCNGSLKFSSYKKVLDCLLLA